jgi:hypothetical protein
VKASRDVGGTQVSEKPRADWRFKGRPYIVEGRSRAARVFRGLVEGRPHISRADSRAALNQPPIIERLISQSGSIVDVFENGEAASRSKLTVLFT